jgi:hypothetical protein
MGKRKILNVPEELHDRLKECCFFEADGDMTKFLTILLEKVEKKESEKPSCNDCHVCVRYNGLENILDDDVINKLKILSTKSSSKLFKDILTTCLISDIIPVILKIPKNLNSNDLDDWLENKMIAISSFLCKK